VKKCRDSTGTEFLANKMSQNMDSGTGSQLSKYKSTCWRWKIITSQLLTLLVWWTSGTTEWTFMTHCPSSLKTFLLRLQVRRTVRWKGFFCVRPAYCWSQKQNDQVIANASLFEIEQKANTGISYSVW